MNGKTQPAYAPEFRQQIVELYASGRGPGELAKEFGCSEASVHAWVKTAGTLRSLPDAGSAVKKVHRQAHQVHVARRRVAGLAMSPCPPSQCARALISLPPFGDNEQNPTDQPRPP